MEILRYFLLFVEALTCILMVGVILLQKSKGQGMGMAFGAGVGEALFGAQAGNVLTKTTVVLAVIFLLNTTILAFIGASHRSSAGKSIADRIPVTKPVSTQPLPSGSPGTDMPAGAIPQSQLPVAAPAAQPVVDQQAPAMPAAAVAPVQPATTTDAKPQTTPAAEPSQPKAK